MHEYAYLAPSQIGLQPTSADYLQSLGLGHFLMNMFSKAHDHKDHLLNFPAVALDLAGHEINAIPAHGACCAHGQELSHVVLV